jgi:hypothetical protein
MANADAAFGLRPVRYASGAPYNGAAQTFYVPATDSTAIYVGGLVKFAGSADANGIPTVTGDITTADVVAGVVVAVDAETADSTTYRAASTARYVKVATDPGLIFHVQEDSVGGALAATNVGNAADLTGLTAGSTTSGRSTIEIDSSTAVAPGTNEDVLILGLAQIAGNEIGANAVWEVRLLNHFYSGDVVGV